VISSGSVTAFAAGLMFGLSLIVVIGAQNTYVLRLGLQRQRVLTVVVLCALSDVVLIAAGVAGAGAVLNGRPGLLQFVRIAGAAFLFCYGALAARRVLRGGAVASSSDTVTTSFAAVVGTALALTWLNPGVYLDTVVLLGSVSHTRAGNQWWFGGGAALGSVLWFTALGYGARLLAPVFRRPRAWQGLDAFVALVMVMTGLRILMDG
jgi:L-lysine exporter family protein LysE/ArgO